MLDCDDEVFGRHSRIWDKELGLYDVRARWYEPDLGAFLAPDPLGAVDSWNFYQYGLAEPNSVFDIFGLQAGNDKPGFWRSVGRGIARGAAAAGKGARFVANFTPIGDINDGCVALFGFDVMYWKRREGLDRAAAWAGVIPFVNGQVVRKGLDAVDDAVDARKASKEGEAAGDAAKTADRATSSVTITDDGWTHVKNEHFSGKPGKSEFTVSESEAKGMVQEAVAKGSRSDGHSGRTVHTYDTGKPVGVDRSTGQTTTSITVVRNADGTLRTAYPGTP